MGVAIPESEIKIAYERATQYAATRAHTNPLFAEEIHDAAVNGLMWAIERCNNLETFQVYCRSAVMRFVSRRIHKEKAKRDRRPLAQALPEQLAGRKTQPVQPTTIEELPKELADTVCFYMVHGFNMRQIGLLMGVSADTVQERLKRAAEMIAGGRDQPERRKGEKRLSAG
jgi:hypothetical protein